MFKFSRYPHLLAEMDQHLKKLGAPLNLIGEFEYHQTIVALFATQLGSGTKQILITAGVHGEEPCGPLSLAEFIRVDLKKYLSRYSFTIIPVINPVGFEKKRRRGSSNRDLNRYFGKTLDYPENRIITQFLQFKRFDHHFDLHEDTDLAHQGLYVYESGDGVNDAQILKKEYQFLAWVEDQGVKVNKNPKVYGAPSRQGIIHVKGGYKHNARVRKIGALVPYLILNDRSLRGTTLETPTHISMTTRVKIQVYHLNFWLDSQYG